MTDTSKMLRSKFLRKEDFEDEMTLTIKGDKEEDMPSGDGPAEKRWVLYFKELAKGLVLNMTTIRMLEKTWGTQSDAWIGKKVTMYVDPNVTFMGKVTGGLRLRPIVPKVKKAPLVAVASAAAKVDPELDDEIPYGDEPKEAS